MIESVSIRQPQLLLLKIEEQTFFGGRQSWYPTRYSRKRGCGPTTASNLFWYLGHTRPECEALLPAKKTVKARMTELMYRVYSFVKPSLAGIYRPDRFAWGASQYGAACGVYLRARVLPVALWKSRRPDADVLRDFLFSAFEQDLPVAFLSRSNGKTDRLNHWHWVTLVGVDASLQAQMYDQADCGTVDLKHWLEHTLLGGAFVVLQPMELEGTDLVSLTETE